MAVKNLSSIRRILSLFSYSKRHCRGWVYRQYVSIRLYYLFHWFFIILIFCFFSKNNNDIESTYLKNIILNITIQKDFVYMNKESLKQHIHQILDLSTSLEGHLGKREVELLACLPFIKSQGEILEIGSFKGKSTTNINYIFCRIKKSKLRSNLLTCRRYKRP